MNLNKTTTLASVLAFAALAAPSGAAAQPVEAGVSAPPTALVLFDTSGSMEWRDDGADHTYPTCVVDGSTSLGEGASRMHAAVEVLTGEVVDRYCAIDARTSSPNRLDQVDPARPQGIRHSRLCSSRTSTANHAVDCVPEDPAVPLTSFPQIDNGLIDEFGDQIAFGFMAFDSFPEEDECADGMFSYGEARSMSVSGGLPSAPANPDNVTSCGANPGGVCWNLGARAPYVNDPLAPNCTDGSIPQGWTIPPVDPTNTLSQSQINAQVQDQILRLVPYWSTPLGAMLEDAHQFYLGDAEYFAYKNDNEGHDYSYGHADPYGECRRRYVLLITDGIPSYDACVRTGTEGPNTDPWDAGCENYPYADAAWYAEQLNNAGIPVYVVGFNIGNTDATVLDDIAAAGGTEEARFADSGLALIFELGDIFSQIASGTPSRTSPANTTRLSASATGRGQFTFEANFEIHEGSPYWTGDISRISRFCDDGQLDDPVEESFADWYDDLEADEVEDLPILTTSPLWHSCYLRNSGIADTSPFQSGLSPNPLLEPYGVTDAEIAEACQVDAPPGTSANAALACQTLGDGGVGLSDSIAGGTLDSRCLAEFDYDVAAAHPNVFGARNATESDAFRRWLRGWTLTELRLLAGMGDVINELLPTAEYRWDAVNSEYSNDRRSRMAPVVHSSPTVVSVPDARLQISEGYATFVEDTRDRPTVVYTGTTDGLLRALNADTRAEIFSFLPASIAYRIGETIRGQRELIDGSPVVADVRTFRDASGTERWKTVLLLPYRSAGRGITALDVTDPYNPRFLWELDAELDPQLGLTYSRPAIGTVFLAECMGNGADACERGVAIFGGGAPPTGLTGWENTNIGRTLYVVDIETGIVLRRFTHMRDNSGTTVPFPAPLVGEVAAFDSFAGSLITRAFVGTLNGQLLRLDLSATDPDNWSVDLFFDPSEDPIGRTDLGGIFFRPTIALSANTGRAVVVFGTGNLDDLDRIVGEQNYVFSVVEAPEYDTDGNLERIGGDLNWAVELEENERMTARPRVFNRAAYFATFKPADDLCDIGGARLYALDFIGEDEDHGYAGPIDLDHFVSYLRENPYSEDTTTNPLVPFHDETTYATLDPQIIPPKSIIYALEITERVSCFEENDLSGSRYGGQNVSIEVSDQGEFVLQIGVSSYTAGAESGLPQAVSQLAELTLEDPPSAIIPTSWSVIFE